MLVTGSLLSLTHRGLPCLSKIIEIVLRNQINDYLNKNTLFSKNKYGFRKKRSTIDAMMYITAFIRKETEQNNFVSAALIDLSQAFDSINHSILETKLVRLRFETSAIHLMKSFLFERMQAAVLQKLKSDEMRIDRGVLQGTVLGTLIFNIFIIDMQTYAYSNTELIQYANDTLILTSDKNLEENKQK